MSYKSIRSNTMDHFILDENETFRKQCGEIFMSSKGRISIHCTLCEEAFCGFEAYQVHLNDHLPLVDGMEIVPETLGVSAYIQTELNKTVQKSEHTTMKTETNFSNNEEIFPDHCLNLNATACLEESERKCGLNSFEFKNSNFEGETMLETDFDKSAKLQCIEDIQKQTTVPQIKHEKNVKEYHNYKCPICGLGFKEKRNMDNHYQRHVNLNSRPGFNLKQLNSKKENFEQNTTKIEPHIVQEFPALNKCQDDECPKHECPMCGLFFKEKCNMQNHYQRHLNSNSRVSFNFEQLKLKKAELKKAATKIKPQVVEEELPVLTDFRDVKKRKIFIGKCTPEEERKHKCPICGMGFKERGNMKHHYKRHSNARSHACPHCNKSFYSSTELNTHIKSHTGERTYLCNECGNAFATTSRLATHMRQHKGQKDYHCQHPGCKMSFYCSSSLKNHMLSHSNERKLKCPTCDAGFKQRTALKNHMKLHENKLEFKCKLCDARFNQNAGLFSHMKCVHKSV